MAMKMYLNSFSSDKSFLTDACGLACGLKLNNVHFKSLYQGAGREDLILNPEKT